MPQLTDQEKQDVLRYLDADKPLPDKYRFLLFGDKRQVELVWNGKTNQVCKTVLPFQTIEQVDEPRAERPADLQLSLFDVDDRGRQLKGWTNKLIWGDNKLILSSLKNGPMRREIEAQGGIKLFYIDPPFDVGADFSMDIEIGGDTLTKRPSVIEQLAYRDTWGQGADSYLAMMYERLVLMRDLLAEDGSIYVHCDWRVSGLVRLTLDDVFGTANFVNEVIWWYEGPQSPSPLKFGSKHDTVFRYARDINRNPAYELMYLKEELFSPKKYARDKQGRYFYTIPKGDYTEASITRLDTEGKIHWTSKGTPRIKKFVEVSTDGKKLLKPKKIPDVWEITSLGLAASSKENLAYPTQKPEALVERIIRASSNEGDLVADVFGGSGTTSAVAEKLGRKWIVADLGKFAIHTTRKRMIGVQRQLKAEGKDYRAFELLNLGRYQRQHYVGVTTSLRPDEQERQLTQREEDYLALILRAYRAAPVQGYRTFHGIKAGRLVAVGPADVPVGRLYVDEVLAEAREKGVTRVDLLAFEFEMGLFPRAVDEARDAGVDLLPRYIPPEVFDKRAVERGQVAFYDMAYVEVKPHVRGNHVAIELTDFSVHYSQDSVAAVEETLRSKQAKIVVERGQVIRVAKDAAGFVTREVLTKHWGDWIDYWAVDFDYESKREIVRLEDPQSGEVSEAWTGDYVFENEWQAFRTKKDRALELRTVEHELTPGRHKVAVKVVDIFGNDTMKVISLSVGGGR